MGDWKAERPDGSSFTLNLTGDSKFTWKFANKDKTQDQAGTYTVADDVLILKQGSEPVMVAQIKPLDDNRFNFRLTGASEADPGLTFVR